MGPGEAEYRVSDRHTRDDLKAKYSGVMKKKWFESITVADTVFKIRGENF